MEHYADSPSWLNFRELAADRFGITLPEPSAELRWTIRGHDVHLDDWQPEGAAKGTLILVHGGGGNGRVLAPLGHFATQCGWRALAPDLPGYGLTLPAPDFRFDYSEWPRLISELADQLEGPVVLMGLSVGGMTAVFAAHHSRNVAGVIATTLLDMSSPKYFARAARWQWLGWASLAGFRLMPWLTDRIALPLWLAAPLRTMSSDKGMQRYFESDPLIGKRRVPARFFRTLHAYPAQDIRLRQPLLLVHPGADKWTPTAWSKEVFDRITAPEKRMVELSNGAHLPVESPAFEELKAEVARFLERTRTSAEAE